MTELIANWNTVATFFAVWGVLALIVGVVLGRIGAINDRKWAAQQEEEQIRQLESMFYTPPKED